MRRRFSAALPEASQNRFFVSGVIRLPDFEGMLRLNAKGAPAASFG
jgi:hypothetical protein